MEIATDRGTVILKGIVKPESTTYIKRPERIGQTNVNKSRCAAKAEDIDSKESTIDFNEVLSL
jgi:hypothetical protein